MSVKIRLTIQEIVEDFEKLVRYDEHLDVLFDSKKADDAKIDEFYKFLTEMMEKYLPNYEKKIDFDVEEVNFENALKLYEKLYENFKEMFYQLV